MMYFLLALIPYAVQLFFIIHIIKNRKPFYWLFAILLLPYIGGLVYFFVHILPDLGKNKAARKIGKTIAETINPLGEVNRLLDVVKAQDTIANRLLLAQAYSDAQLYPEAIDWYIKCLEGPYKNDRTILFPLAHTYFLNNQVDKAQEITSELEKEKAFETLDEKLLVVLIKEAQGEQVFDQLEQLYERSDNFETGYYYVRALLAKNETEKAREIVADMKETLKTYRNFRDIMGPQWVLKSERLL